MPSSTLYCQRTVGAVAKSTAVASGTASIGNRHAAFPARGRDNTVKGGDFTVATITVSPTSKTLSAAQTVQLTAVCKNAAGDILPDIPTWASSDQTKATVDTNGKVTAVATGSANITATVGSTNSSAVAITVS